MKTTVLFNRPLAGNFYHMRVHCPHQPKMGQFYMLRSWEDYPLLSRPLSVFDCDQNTVDFLYKVVGKGTDAFSRLLEGNPIFLEGPYGNGFPILGGKIALVGGGVGIAPLLLAAKTLIKQGNPRRLDIFLGFSSTPVCSDLYQPWCHRLLTRQGGLITNAVSPENYDVIFTCGPTPMMQAMVQKCNGHNVDVYVSLENRMACGFGVCLVCSCATLHGNKKVCVDGPVFPAKEVMFHV